MFQRLIIYQKISMGAAKVAVAQAQKFAPYGGPALIGCKLTHNVHMYYMVE
jgi:hypothetical protein